MTPDYVSFLGLCVSGAALSLSVLSLAANFYLIRAGRAGDIVAKYVELQTQWSRGTDKIDMQLSFILLMAQRVLAAYPFSAKWRKLMKDQLGYYRKDLLAWNKEDPSYFKNFGWRVDRLVQDVLKSEPA
jgi:hypothetical protein